MTLIVEDGTGLPDAESYASVATCVEYADDMGKVFPGTDVAASEQALRRATQYIDGYYGDYFDGYPVKRREQALLWPRYDAYDYNQFFILPTEIPRELIAATCEAAIMEFAQPGILQPNLARGGKIKRLKADTVEIEYMDGAEPTTTFQTIDSIIAPILSSSYATNTLTGRAVRG